MLLSFRVKTFFSHTIPTNPLFNKYFVIEVGQTFSSQLSQIKIQRTLFRGHSQLNLNYSSLGLLIGQ